MSLPKPRLRRPCPGLHAVFRALTAVHVQCICAMSAPWGEGGPRSPANTRVQPSDSGRMPRSWDRCCDISSRDWQGREGAEPSRLTHTMMSQAPPILGGQTPHSEVFRLS